MSHTQLDNPTRQRPHGHETDAELETMHADFTKWIAANDAGKGWVALGRTFANKLAAIDTEMEARK